MPISALAGLAFGVAVFAIGVYHFAYVRPMLGRLSAVAGSTHAAVANETAGTLERLECASRADACRIGFVRFNAFADVGSDQSFTLALLNDAGDGVVVTSIHSRDDARTYGKAVRRFTPQQSASKEEQSAIAMARTGVGV